MILHVNTLPEAGRVPPGAHTPAQAHGKDFIAELDGVTVGEHG